METSNIADLVFRFRYLVLILFIGLILLGFGVFFLKNADILSSTKIEVLDATTEAHTQSTQIVVEISGEVEKPGVYNLQSGLRIEDLLVAAGGLSQNADRTWVDKNLNRAAKLTDAQKVYIPAVNQQSNVLSANNNGGYQTASSNFSDRGSGHTNINLAPLKELDSLPGIGPVYAQNIIDHRPYSTIEELLSKGVLKKSVYEKIKDKITVY